MSSKFPLLPPCDIPLEKLAPGKTDLKKTFINETLPHSTLGFEVKSQQGDEEHFQIIPFSHPDMGQLKGVSKIFILFLVSCEG